MTQQVYSDNINSVKLFMTTKHQKPERFIQFIEQFPELPFKSSYVKPFVHDLSPLVDMELGMSSGQVRRFTDPYRRQGVVIALNALGCKPRNVVIYQNYAGHSDAIVCRGPSILHAIYGKQIEGWLSYEMQEVLLGMNNRRNIGETFLTIRMMEQV